MRPYYFLLLISLFFFSCSIPQDKPKEILRVSAAASLTDVITEISEHFEHNTDYRVELNFASSSMLAKQIEKGLNCDVYLSANPAWMKYLKDKKLVEEGSIRTLLTNSLIIVIPLSSMLTISEVEDLKRSDIKCIAIADPSHVPAGKYAREVLISADIWKDVQKKIIGALDVRAALAFVENNAADCGIVYSTDIFFSKKVKKILAIPEEYSPDINYMLSIIKGKKNEKSTKFVEYILEEPQKKIFEKYGFKCK